jgi:hypothetical protein
MALEGIQILLIGLFGFFFALSIVLMIYSYISASRKENSPENTDEKGCKKRNYYMLSNFAIAFWSLTIVGGIVAAFLIYKLYKLPKGSEMTENFVKYKFGFTINYVYMFILLAISIILFMASIFSNTESTATA